MFVQHTIHIPTRFNLGKHSLNIVRFSVKIRPPTRCISVTAKHTGMKPPGTYIAQTSQS